MGKKSRLKRERRLKKSGHCVTIWDGGHHEVASCDTDFRCCSQQLAELFSQYNAKDVAIALGVSELWLPNIASPVKHHFAMCVFVSMREDQFNQSNGIDGYVAFCDFIRKVYALLPNFPSLEDFIPEPDWGSVRVVSQSLRLKVFYGGSVERITDFIEAFKLKYTQ